MSKEVLKSLRSLMHRTRIDEHSISAYIVTSSDQHNSEYLAECDKRRQYLTGFTGSAGIAVVTATNAFLLTDTRYTLQAKFELDSEWEVIDFGSYTKESFKRLFNAINIPKQSTIAIDSMYISHFLWKGLMKNFEIHDFNLRLLDYSLIDQIWINKPLIPDDPIFCLGDEFTGKIAQVKILQVQSEMAKQAIDYHVVTELDNIAWCLNLRGNDINYNPVFFAYLIVSKTSTDLFVNRNKLNDSVKKYLELINCKIHDYGVQNVLNFLRKLSENSKRVLISCNSNEFLVSNAMKLDNLQIIIQESPITYLKAKKCEKELDIIRSCHIRDSVAICMFLNWLETNYSKENVTEISASEKLLEFRSKMENFKGPSFATISSVGKHAAIIHYKPKSNTDTIITNDDVYLCDSGGHYLDGTTDVTRTLHFGQPTDTLKDYFTYVLKGFICLHTTKFPEKISASTLDSIARQFLWQHGLDYGHGTGHGVGTYLCVHEKPIIGRHSGNSPPLDQGVIITIEPGYYEEDKYGIRIENVTEVIEAMRTNEKYLTFRSLTYVPIQLTLVNKKLLTEFEIDFLNEYHKNCRANLCDFLEKHADFDPNENVKKWIIKNTEEI